MGTTKSTFSVTFFVQRTKVNQRNGLAPILGRITVNGDKVHFSTKMQIAPDRWLTDENGKSLGRTIGKSVAERKINQNLDELKMAITSRYNQMIILDMEITAAILRDSFFKKSAGKPASENRPETKMLVEHFEKYNEKFKEMVKLGKRTPRSWNRYDFLLRKVKEFMLAEYNIDNIPLKKVTTKFFEDLFLWLRRTYPTPRGHNYHMKMVQRLGTVYRKAIVYGYVKDDPFANFEITYEKTDRGYLDEKEVKALMTKRMPSTRLDNIRDIFIFSCFTGLSYCDVQKLRKDEIVPDAEGNLWIRTERGKTKIKCDIPLLDIPLQIIEKHKTSDDNELLLSIPSNQKVNDYLKEIAAICGIEKRLSFHLARHTFATTTTLLNGVPIETVSKMLGHSNIRTTQIYARVIDTKVSRDMDLLKKRLGRQEILQTGTY